MAALAETVASYFKDKSMPSLRHFSFTDVLDFIRETPSLQFVLFIVIAALCVNLGLNPFLSAVLRAPLRKRFGLQFGEIRFRFINLTLKLTDIELSSTESSIIRTIILAVFPSAHVKNVEGYSESRVTMKYLSVKIRISSFAAFFSTDIPSDRYSHVDVKLGKQHNVGDKKIYWIYHFIPKPYIKIKLHHLDIRVEKAYLAPTPPDFCRSSPPSSVPSFDVSNLPTFEQDSMVDWVTHAEIYDAENVTFFIERWIDHVKAKYTADESKTQKPTHDEKINSFISSISLILLQSFTLQVFNAAIIISGAGSEYVKETRKKYGPRHSNYEFAILPQNKRSLTIGNAEMLSLHFSPDLDCIGVLCLVGTTLKVGHPTSEHNNEEPGLESVVSELEATKCVAKYDWHTVVHPFDIVTEVNGIIPIVIWAINYDHYWDTRLIDVTLSSSEMAVSLSPSHIHTLFLHLDDYSDGNSPCNEWIQWLMTNFHRSLNTYEREKLAYCEGYAQIKGTTPEKAKTKELTDTLRKLEKRMSRFEIISLRCIAMEKYWKIPKSSSKDELADFLENSLSSIVKSAAISLVPFEEPTSPFQRKHHCALRALVSLCREKFSFLSPSFPIKFHCSILHTDFPSDTDDTIDSFEQSIPSSIGSHDVDFLFELKSLIFSRERAPTSARRCWMNMALQIREIEWSVLIMSLPELPKGMDGSPVGIVYKHRHQNMKKALSLELKVDLEPTELMDAHYNLSLDSSNMSVVLNPIPILSALKTLLRISDIPLTDIGQSETNSQSLVINTENDIGIQQAEKKTGYYFSMPNITAEVNVECCSVIFLIDRMKLRRGVLDFNICELSIIFDMAAPLAKIVVSAEPFELCAGQHQQFGDEINWVLMPLKPIIMIEEARVLAYAKEKVSKQKSTLNVSLDVGVGNFSLDAGPSTICGLSEAIQSLYPFLDCLTVDIVEEEKQKQEEKKRQDEEQQLLLQEKRKALKEMYESVDRDGSGTLQDEELSAVIRLMLESEATCRSEQLTEHELEVQTAYFLSILDPARSNDIPFQEFDGYLFRVANSIDDVNLAPKLTTSEYLGRTFNHCDFFLSSHLLRRLVNYEDLREYASWHEVHRIIGDDNLVERLPFPPPNFWFEGGILRFWEIYEEETGCAKHSLNGQSIESVQRKLVRALRNYEFAKFCWRSLVQPELQSEMNDNDSMAISVSSWVIDTNTKMKLENTNVVDRILETISQTQEDINTSSLQTGDSHDVNYDLSFDFAIAEVSFAFGSAHTFTKPLIDVNFTGVKISAMSLLSPSGFVPTEKESKDTNQITFQGVFSVIHLNTRHDFTEMLIEPYPCFGHVIYKYLKEMDEENMDEPERTSVSVRIDCPRSMNINLSPSAVESATVLQQIIIESNPTAYRKWIAKRDVNLIRNIWSDFTSTDSDPYASLSRHDAIQVLRQASKSYWKDETGGFSSELMDKLILTAINLTETDERGLIPFQSLEQVLIKMLSRCYFSGCRDLHIRNRCGRSIKISTKSSNRGTKSHSEYGSYDLKEGSPKLIKDGRFGSVTLETSEETASSGRQELEANISLSISGYRTIDDVAISPYQPFMLALKLPQSSKRRRRKIRASGFSPNLTVIPEQGSLTSISLFVRTALAIKTDYPVNIIRIVQLPKSFGRSRQGKTKLDLSKLKHISGMLKVLVEGAPIVFEVRDIAEDETVPVPVHLINSSRHHALLIQDLDCPFWRHPVLLNKSFLYNQMNMSQVNKCHAMSGIVVKRERLHIVREKKKSSQGATKTETSLDCSIHVVPLFKLQNSLPFDVSIKLWQLADEEDDDLLWQDPSLYTRSDSTFDDDSSDDDSAMTPTSQAKTQYLDQNHYSSGRDNQDFYFNGSLESCEILRLSGISLRQPIFLQVSQRVNSSDSNFMWSNPVLLNLDKLKTGANQRKGLFSLAKIILDLGDEVDALVDVSVDQASRMPTASIYCPYWIMNKTGMKMEYKVIGQSKTYYDGGVGGLPVMLHGAKAHVSNAAYKKVSRQISVIPLECPNDSVANFWWEESTNGKLIMRKFSLTDQAGWSDNIEMDAAGTAGQLNCKHVVLNTAIDSLAGAYHRSSLVTISPRYVVKNKLHISITLIPLSGGQQDVINKAHQLRDNPTAKDRKEELTLKPGESTLCYTFHDVSYEGIDSPRRWVAFRVNAARSQGPHKWHAVPIDRMDCFHYGEHDGLDTMCGIIEAKVSSAGGSNMIVIAHSATPPFRIENRSSSHYIQFVQDDDDSTVFELPPMHSCGYTWDSPWGKRQLIATVVAESERKDSLFSKGLQIGGKCKDLILPSQDNDTVNDVISIASPGSENKKKPQYTTKLERFVRSGQQKYDMLQPGRQKDLPKKATDWKDLPNNTVSTSHNLYAHLRIMAGTKILSFNDSDFLAEQVERGNLKKGGGFKHAQTNCYFEGLALYVIDDFNRELLGITARDIRVIKPKGSIEATLRVRHFQVDAMLNSARYPIILQPLPLGVDRRQPLHDEKDDVLNNKIVTKKDCFWESHNELPIPLLEFSASYVPQTNMIWMPSCRLLIAPCKVEVDVDYILKVAGVFIDAAAKFQDESKKLTGRSTANDKLQYTSRGFHAKTLTYIENLYIAPLYFDIELNIKPDDSDEDESYETLTLSAIAQSTNSALVAGILSWLINVGSNFAHVSPSFRYKEVTDSDRYCDAVDLALDLAMSYVVHTIKQCYKVVFSMHLLGDPSLYAYQVKTGVTDLFIKTRDEIASGGKDGVGQGVASFFSNVVGGVFEWGGKVTGGLAETIDSVVTSEYTSNHLKASQDKPAQNVIDGVVQGTEYMTRTVAHGFAGLIGDPYRGLKKGGVVGLTKGAVSGVSGAFFSPFIGALGFVAKTSEGMGENSKMLNLAVIESRCRPARRVPWGSPMVQSELSFLKGVGIRVHTVRYQKVRRQVILQDDPDIEMSPKDIKRARAAEERRKYPPYKAISVVHNKQRQHYLTNKAKPKLLPDRPGKVALSHYAVTFGETIIIRTTDLQLDDKVKVNFWNHKGLKLATTKSRPLAYCTLNVSDIYASIVEFYKKQLAQKEKRFAEEVNIKPSKTDNDPSLKMNVPSTQEFCLFRPCKSNLIGEDILECVREEIISIQKKEEDAFGSYDSDFDSDSDDDIYGGKKKAKKDMSQDDARANERLYGTISLSFFPIPW